MRKFACILTVFLLTALSFNAWAAVTHYVHDSDGLQKALDAARHNHESDNIFIYEGIYYGNFKYQGIDDDNYTLLIGGYSDQGKPSDDPSLTVLDGEQKDRVLLCNFTGGLLIKNLTLQNGRSENYGGGAYIHAHQEGMYPDLLHLENNIIRNNHAKYGGGIAIIGDNPDVLVSDNLISGNTSICTEPNSFGGGGLLISHWLTGVTFEDDYQVILSNNTFNENRSANNGGAVYVRSRSDDGPTGLVKVMGNEFTNNRTEDGGDEGGGIYIHSTSNGGKAESAPIILRDNVIQKNGAHGMGGGGFIRSFSKSGKAASITVERNVILENDAQNGGGLELRTFGGKENGHSGEIYLSANIVAENSAKKFAGGISAWSDSSPLSAAGNIIVTNNEITENRSGDDIGGIYLVSGIDSFNPGDVIVTNNTIANNDAPDRCGGLFLHGNGNTFEVYNNIVWGNSADSGEDIFPFCSATFNGFNNNYSSMIYSWTNEGGNIDHDPLFVSGDDYHINYFSPCRNAGTASAPALPQVDIDGDDRIIGSTPDMGADEAKLDSSKIIELLKR